MPIGRDFPQPVAGVLFKIAQQQIDQLLLPIRFGLGPQALEKGTVDAADYTGPAVNWDLGFQQVSKYIWTGPPGLESVYQPVDLMDFVVRMDVWNKLSPKMKVWLDDEIQVLGGARLSPGPGCDRTADHVSNPG